MEQLAKNGVLNLRGLNGAYTTNNGKEIRTAELVEAKYGKYYGKTERRQRN